MLGLVRVDVEIVHECAHFHMVTFHCLGKYEVRAGKKRTRTADKTRCFILPPSHRGKKVRLKGMQVECQCRATSGNLFFCIVLSKLREDGAAWTRGDSRGPVPQGGVFGQGFAIIIWPSESGDQALCNSLGFCKRLSNTLFSRRSACGEVTG